MGRAGGEGQMKDTHDESAGREQEEGSEGPRVVHVVSARATSMIRRAGQISTVLISKRFRIF